MEVPKEETPQKQASSESKIDNEFSYLRSVDDLIGSNEEKDNDVSTKEVIESAEKIMGSAELE